jgi:hypothetical protein
MFFNVYGNFSVKIRILISHTLSCHQSMFYSIEFDNNFCDYFSFVLKKMYSYEDNTRKCAVIENKMIFHCVKHDLLMFMN